MSDVTFVQHHPKTDFDIKHELGKGNYSVVKMAVHKKTGEKSAIKVIKKKKCREERD